MDLGNNIFELDRLIIPVNVQKNHWFVICVLFQHTSIVVYDSLPAEDGRLEYLKTLFNEYILKEYSNFNGVELPYPGEWNLIPCFPKNDIAPRQDKDLNNCGVYTAMFMELLINKVEPLLLNGCLQNIETSGRYALWQSILSNRPIFFDCYRPPQEGTLRSQNDPSVGMHNLFPLTSSGIIKGSGAVNTLSKESACLPAQSDYSGPFKFVDIPKNEAPYIEEIDYTRNNTEPMRKPWPFHFSKPDLHDGVEWEYDEEQRLVTVDFSAVECIDMVHKIYLAELMERDDITVTCKGLLPCKLDPNELLQELTHVMGDQQYPTFRRFDRREKDGVATYHEKTDRYVSMKIDDYVRHLTLLTSDKAAGASFSYVNENGTEETLPSAADAIFYLLDMSMSKHTNSTLQHFSSNFKMKEILPGGEWCLFQYVSHIAELNTLSFRSLLNVSLAINIHCYQ